MWWNTYCSRGGGPIQSLWRPSHCYLQVLEFFFGERAQCSLFVATILDSTGVVEQAVIDKKLMWGKGGKEARKRERECLLENYSWSVSTRLPWCLTVTCHALAVDQSKSSSGPIVWELSSASTKTNPRDFEVVKVIRKFFAMEKGAIWNTEKIS